jgi:pyruvate dehydrogenase E2 component (dihydrolipoamide acetyltransferase)
VSPNARRVAAWHDIDPSTVAGTGPNGRVVSEDVLDAVGDPRRPHATTAAHQAAARLGVDLTTIAPPGGRPIDRADVERHARTARSDAFDPPSATVPSSDEAPLLQTPSSTVPLTGMRGTIASRMSSSLRDMAQLTLTMDVVMDAVVDHRSAAPPPGRATITDYVVAAAAAALVEHPIVNSQINAGHVALLPEVHVGLAVALDGGLVVPVVKRTDTLDLPALSAETRRLVSAARDGTLTLAEIEGATFSVSTLGAYGVDAFTPVINPPNTAILGVGRLRDGVRWDGSRPLRTSVLTLSLTWDHRAFDGVPAAEFTATVRDRLQRWGQP